MLITAIATIISTQSCLPAMVETTLFRVNANNTYLSNKLILCETIDNHQLQVSIPFATTVKSRIDNWNITNSKEIAPPSLNFSSDKFKIDLSQGNQSASISTGDISFSVNQSAPSWNFKANSFDPLSDIQKINTDLQLENLLTLRTEYEGKAGKTISIGAGDNFYSTEMSKNNWQVGFTEQQRFFNTSISTLLSNGSIRGSYVKKDFTVAYSGAKKLIQYNYSDIEIHSSGKMYLNEENVRLLSDLDISGTLQTLEILKPSKHGSFGFSTRYLKGDITSLFRARSGLLTLYASNLSGTDNSLGWVELFASRKLLWSKFQSEFKIKQLIPVYSSGEIVEVNMLDNEANTDVLPIEVYRFGDGLSVSLSFTFL